MAYSIDLTGKVAVVTGAVKGIGAATAYILAEAGAQVVIDDIVAQENADPMLDEIEKVGLRPFYYQQDISAAENARSLIQSTLDRFSRVDFLINNAGVVADWDKSYAVHVKGVYNCSEAVKDHMAQRGSGRIVNLTSDTFAGAPYLYRATATP